MGKDGRIIMISGIDSVRMLPGHGVLGAAKAALESMVRDLAFELGPREITVNGVNVGYMDTDSSRFYFGAEFETMTQRSSSRCALKRLPTLEEIAAVVCLYACRRRATSPRQTIMVDGGLTWASRSRHERRIERRKDAGSLGLWHLLLRRPKSAQAIASAWSGGWMPSSCSSLGCRISVQRRASFAAHLRESASRRRAGNPAACRSWRGDRRY